MTLYYHRKLVIQMEKTPGGWMKNEYKFLFLWLFNYN